MSCAEKIRIKWYLKDKPTYVVDELHSVLVKVPFWMLNISKIFPYWKVFERSINLQSRRASCSSFESSSSTLCAKEMRIEWYLKDKSNYVVGELHAVLLKLHLPCLVLKKSVLNGIEKINQLTLPTSLMQCLWKFIQLILSTSFMEFFWKFIVHVLC